MFRDDEYVEILYGSKTLVFQNLHGNGQVPINGDGLYLVILERQKGYPVSFISLYNENEYNDLVDKISDSNEK